MSSAVSLPVPAFPVPAPPAPVPHFRAAKPQRARLWELNPSVHCSVIGTCLTTGELRSAMGKVLQQDISDTSDHDLHGRAVSLCSRQGEAARLLHKTLDRRHDLAIRRFARLQGEAAIMEAWAAARRAGEVPGAYWALLTHPDAGHAAMKKAFGDVHMLSHLVGASNRADIRHLAALEDENAALRAKVDRQQARLHEAVAAREAALAHLASLSARPAPGGPAVPEAETIQGLRALVAELERRQAQEAGRRERAERRASEAEAAARLWQGRAKEAQAGRDAASRELQRLERPDDGPPPCALHPERILYVGGRPGAVDQVRAALEQAGGTLLRHDGGQHDNPALLAGLIGGADRVVFPVDCVSHDAARSVKRLCRQLGKPWTALRSSGLGSFLAALALPCDHRVAP